MFNTFGHTFELIKTSWRVLMMDKELILFPIMTAISLAILVGILAGIGYDVGTIDHLTEPTKINPDTGLEENQVTQTDIVLVGLLFFGGYFIVIFFNAALISAAQERLRGGDPNVSSGLSHAARHVHTIFLWAMIAAVVGLIFLYLKSRSRDNFAGRIGISFLEAGWAMITFFVVPILVTEGVGPVEAMKRSTSLFTTTWGRQLVSSFGFLVIYIGVAIGAIVISLPFAMLAPLLGIAVGFVLLVIGLGSVYAMEGIFKAALYDYARGEKPLIFKEEDLRTAYSPRPAAAGA